MTSAPPWGRPSEEGAPVEERTGASHVERTAVRVVAAEIAAMPASLVVQLAIWPDEIAVWARVVRLDSSVVYNALAARKPYRAVRERIAERLEVLPGVLGQLIEASRPLPGSRRDPARAPTPPDEPVDWSAPPFPRHRDGSNPIEQRAIATVAREIAALPASTVVGLALWPETITGWARGQRVPQSAVWATLAGAPSTPVRALLARRLGASDAELARLILARRQVPAALRPGQQADTPEAEDRA